MKTITHAKVVQLKNLSLKQKIESVLGWTELEYCNFQLEMGMRYLELELEQNTEAIKKVAYTRLFWAWWRNHWAIRDAKFFSQPQMLATDFSYRRLNDPNTLLFASNNKHLSKSYAVMASKLIKAATGHD